MMEKTQVQYLRKGDILSSGARILENPYPETHEMYGKNKLCIKVRYLNGNVKYQRWGKYTTVSLMSSEQAVADANDLIQESLKMFEA